MGDSETFHKIIMYGSEKYPLFMQVSHSVVVIVVVDFLSVIVALVTSVTTVNTCVTHN